MARTGDDEQWETREEVNDANTITKTDDPAPSTSPTSNCSQGGFQMLAGDDERHHTDTNSRSNRRQR